MWYKQEVLEKQKVKYLEKMQNEIIATHKNAQERIAMVEAKKGEMFWKLKKLLLKFGPLKSSPKKFGFFNA